MSAPDDLAPVRGYYETRGESELHRLDNPYEGLVEHEIHARALAELLPAQSHVLDLGGGPGHWTAWLLERGHRVVLADLSPRMLAIGARELARRGMSAEAVVECDARDLRAFRDREFDVVLSMGPFYHLVDPRDRARARDEATRVLRPGGLLVATLMTRYGWLLTTALAGALDAAGVRRLLDEGSYRSTNPGPLTEAALVRPEEVVPFFEAAGLETVRLLASQGFLNQVQEQLADLRLRDPAVAASLVDAAYEAAADPSIHGLSGHLLYAGTKPG